MTDAGMLAETLSILRAIRGGGPAIKRSGESSWICGWCGGRFDTWDFYGQHPKIADSTRHGPDCPWTRLLGLLNAQGTGLRMPDGEAT